MTPYCTIIGLNLNSSPHRPTLHHVRAHTSGPHPASLPPIFVYHLTYITCYIFSLTNLYEPTRRRSYTPTVPELCYVAQLANIFRFLRFWGHVIHSSFLSYYHHG